MPRTNYREPIIIQRLTANTPTDCGDPAVSSPDNWTTYFQCMAEMIVKGGKDFVKAGQQEAECTHIFHVPFSVETVALAAMNFSLQLPAGAQTIGEGSDIFRIQLVVTGEILHIADAYRRDSQTREIEILAVD